MSEEVIVVVDCTNLSEEVVVDLEPVVGEGLCEVVGGTDEEVVSDHISDHLLVEVTVIGVLPVRVLEPWEHGLQTQILCIYYRSSYYFCSIANIER